MKNHNVRIERPFRPFHPIQIKGKFQYGIGIDNESLPVGKYKVSIINDNTYKQIENIKFRLVAYPVSEFLDLIFAMVLIPVIISFVSLVICFFYLAKKRELLKG